jgi:predicted secreted protein
MAEKTYNVLDGTDLILSIGGVALAFSTGCKITTTAETGERVTKEASSGKWGEKYVKKFSEEISADGCNLVNGDDDMPTYDQLKEAMLNGTAVTAQYSVREGSTRSGKTAGGYKGSYLITSIDLDAQAGDDSKYSVKLENVGAVTKVGDGLTETTA